METILNFIVKIIEKRIKINSMSVSKDDTIEELKEKVSMIYEDNTVQIKRSNVINGILRIFSSIQFVALLKIILLYKNMKIGNMEIDVLGIFMYRMYLYAVFIILFSSALSGAIYSKSLKNVLNTNPQILNRIIGKDGEYEKIFGEINEDSDITTMSQLYNLFEDEDDSKKDTLYILIHSILINKAVKNFNISAMCAILVIGILDAIYIGIILGELSL
ncbi:MAG: hypothetical protein ACRC0G_07605 [Fusobacteriaceae bacterium]